MKWFGSKSRDAVVNFDKNRKYSPAYIIEHFIANDEMNDEKTNIAINIKEFEIYGDKCVQLIVMFLATMLLDFGKKDEMINILPQKFKHDELGGHYTFQVCEDRICGIENGSFGIKGTGIEEELHFIYNATLKIQSLIDEQKIDELKVASGEFKKRTFRVLGISEDYLNLEDNNELFDKIGALFADTSVSKGALYALCDIIIKNSGFNPQKNEEDSVLMKFLAGFIKVSFYSGYNKDRFPQIFEDVRYITQPFVDYFDRNIAPRLIKKLLDSSNFSMLDINEKMNQIFKNYLQIARREGLVRDNISHFDTHVEKEPKKSISQAIESYQTVLLDRSDGTVLLERPYLEGELDGRKIQIMLTKDRFLIGRQMEVVDYAFGSAKSISRVHAEIVTNNGKAYVSDKGSSNGTFVNGNRIMSGQQCEINNNDKISFANLEFKFVNP